MNNIELPYDKFRRLGAKGLTDTELLAIIIRNGTPQLDVMSLAAHILDLCGEDNRILGLQNISYDELLSIKGIGEVKAMCIGCIVELSKRMAMQYHNKELKFDNPEKIACYYMEQFRHLDHEEVMLLLIDKKCNLIKEMILSVGTIDSSILSTRDVFINALKYKAGGIILIHNHPSGDPTPSKMDIEITIKIKNSGDMIDIPLFDHIIIGDKRFVSLCKEGVLKGVN